MYNEMTRKKGEEKMNEFEELEEWEEFEHLKKSTLVRHVIIKLATFSAVALMLGGVAKASYEKGYAFSSAITQDNTASRNYKKYMELLEDISLSKEKNLSKEIYGVTSINVGSSEFYTDANETLKNIETKEELESFAYAYLREYVTQNNDSLNEGNVSFEGKGIYYNSEMMDLDADAIYVIGSILESLQSIPSGLTAEEEKEWVKSVVKQIIASELYQVEENNSKKLELKPCERETI